VQNAVQSTPSHSFARYLHMCSCTAADHDAGFSDAWRRWRRNMGFISERLYAPLKSTARPSGPSATSFQHARIAPKVVVPHRCAGLVTHPKRRVSGPSTAAPSEHEPPPLIRWSPTRYPRCDRALVNGGRDASREFRKNKHKNQKKTKKKKE